MKLGYFVPMKRAGVAMADRAELVEAALDVYPEGVALLDMEERIVLWNRAAEHLTGFSSADLLGRPIPAALAPLMLCCDLERANEVRNGPQLGRGTLVHAQHKQGYDVATIARRVILRDGLGQHIGIASVFHPGEHLSALPHGDTCEGSEVRESQSELEDRLQLEFETLLHEAVPLSLLWIAVDQASEMRKTHGARACEAMIENVERTLANGLRPGEEVGRWGDDEFLMIAHEGDARAMAARGQVLAGLARTADFRWWGDRVSLTVSVGAAVAEKGESLSELLARVQGAMLASVHAGGNHTTLAAGRMPCSQL